MFFFFFTLSGHQKLIVIKKSFNQKLLSSKICCLVQILFNKNVQHQVFLKHLVSLHKNISSQFFSSSLNFFFSSQNKFITKVLSSQKCFNLKIFNHNNLYSQYFFNHIIFAVAKNFSLQFFFHHYNLFHHNFFSIINFFAWQKIVITTSFFI